MSCGDVMVVDVEEGFSDFSIKPGRGFEKKSYTKGVTDHKQIGDVIFIPASLSGTRKAEMSPDRIVGAAIDRHHISVGINNPPVVAGPKPKFVGKRSRSGRRSLLWILHPRRLLFLLASLSIMGTMILIYLTLLTSKGNNPTM